MKLLEAIKSNDILLLDGATGTQLDKRGIMGKADANLANRDIVLEIQRQYVQSGSEAIISNTCVLNRIYIESHNIDVPIEQINKAGIEIAREAIGPDKFVLGDISSTGQLLEPYGTYKESQFYDA